VAPTAAEYRLLGANQALLATLRAATGGRAIALPEEPWRHDLATTNSFTQLWPLLLVLALLLWPLDIALRRVSLGRRELVDARRAVGAWRAQRRFARRTAPVEGMLAARERAGGASARAALLRPESAAPAPAVRPNASDVPAGPARSTPPVPTAPAAPVAAVEPAPTDTITRLREAKKRARGE
jgi:hypothetical protein